MDGMTGIPLKAYSGIRVKDSLKVINRICFLNVLQLHIQYSRPVTMHFNCIFKRAADFNYRLNSYL